MKKAKIYLSDEGFGHIVRQQAIIEQLIIHSNNSIEFTVQTHNHIEAARRIMSNVNFIDRYNNISWQKHSNGSPNMHEIKKHFNLYELKSDKFIENESKINFDFIISDFEYCKLFKHV